MPERSGIARRIVWLLGLALIWTAVAAHAGSLNEQITAYLEQSRLAEDAPALSAAVAVRGEIVYARGFGYADLNNLVPATEATVYNIGSVSKVNAVVAIMQLVEKGRVDLDAAIQTYVPSFPKKQAPITLRHILTHTSGIRHYNSDDFPVGSNYRENLKRFESIVDALTIFQDDPLLFDPGQSWSYSSYASNLLQAVVEEASGVGFEEYLTTYVWEPAGMLATSFDVPERIVRHRSRGYRRAEDGRLMHEPYGDVSYKFAGGGMISTVVDQVHLGVALNRGILLGRKATEEMYTPLAPARPVFRRPGQPPRTLPFGQGLVWRVEKDFKGRQMVHHGGSVRGFRTALVNYPQQDLVVAVMINTASRPAKYARALAMMLLERLAEVAEMSKTTPSR